MVSRVVVGGREGVRRVKRREAMAGPTRGWRVEVLMRAILDMMRRTGLGSLLSLLFSL